MVTVSISEVYDLHTIVDKMTLIGVHTPTKELIQKTYPGLCMNYKYFRIKSVDVALATSQRLALSWEQVGTDVSQVNPQDSMNPILYKAVSNDSWSTLEARLMALAGAGIGNIAGSMAIVENDEVTPHADEHGVYYSLLSNRDGFKIADPQKGLTMKGLRPLVFEKYYTHGENKSSVWNENSAPGIAPDLSKDGHPLHTINVLPKTLRGNAHPMPKINTAYVTYAGSGDASGYLPNGMGDGTPANCQIEMPDIPPVMLGAIIIPPASSLAGVLYYRMVTRCYIEFTDVRPITEVTDFYALDTTFASEVYHSDYIEQSKKMDATTEMVDIRNGDIKKIMEGR